MSALHRLLAHGHVCRFYQSGIKAHAEVLKTDMVRLTSFSRMYSSTSCGTGMLSSAMSRLLPTATRTSAGLLGDSALGLPVWPTLGLPPLRCRGLPGPAALGPEVFPAGEEATHPTMPFPAPAQPGIVWKLYQSTSKTHTQPAKKLLMQRGLEAQRHPLTMAQHDLMTEQEFLMVMQRVLISKQANSTM